jgi:hypothetical protein
MQKRAQAAIEEFIDCPLGAGNPVSWGYVEAAIRRCLDLIDETDGRISLLRRANAWCGVTDPAAFPANLYLEAIANDKELLESLQQTHSRLNAMLQSLVKNTFFVVRS